MMLDAMKRILVLLGLSMSLGACGPDLAGLRGDSPTGQDGTLQLAQPDLNAEKVAGSQQARTQSQPEAVQENKPTTPPPPTQQPTVDQAQFPKKPDIPNATKATITTDKGDIVIKFFSDKAPDTVSNFSDKAQAGFYDGLTFHRVEDWVIQGGDPEGTGRGGGTMPTEINSQAFVVGSVGVARGSDINVSNDSQFFICIADCSWLSNKYTNFGEVVLGLDVAQNISKGDKIVSIEVE
jgi:cyclophilin family peptidyl-prolyl cis-trans isomerase